jgi:nucleoside-diphosphate-sugar epimerase
MKIVVIGGSGLVGSTLVTKLREQGHETLAASPASGVNTLTGQGLAAVLEGASVVTDVSNAPSFEDAAVLEFFETSSRNLSPPNQPSTWGTTWRCQSWGPSGCNRAATSGRRWPRRS